jgi:hypothetical protein
LKIQRIPKEQPGARTSRFYGKPAPLLLISTPSLAVHEIRSNEEKVQFLKECYRLCRPNGMVIMVEHLRDLPNFPD